MNFGETHNDHLQVAAETGLPGYALLAGAIALPRDSGRGGAATTRHRGRASRRSATPFARRWRRRSSSSPSRSSRCRLAAPRLMFLTLGAIAISWDRPDA